MNSTKHDIQMLSCRNNESVSQFSNDWSDVTPDFDRLSPMAGHTTQCNLTQLWLLMIGNSRNNNIALGQSIQISPLSEPVDKTSQKTTGLRGSRSVQSIQSFNGGQTQR